MTGHVRSAQSNAALWRDEAVAARRQARFYADQGERLDSDLLRQAAATAYARADKREKQAAELLAEVRG